MAAAARANFSLPAYSPLTVKSKLRGFCDADIEWHEASLAESQNPPRVHSTPLEPQHQRSATQPPADTQRQPPRDHSSRLQTVQLPAPTEPPVGNSISPAVAAADASHASAPLPPPLEPPLSNPSLADAASTIRAHAQFPTSFSPSAVLMAAQLLTAARATPGYLAAGDPAAAGLAISQAAFQSQLQHESAPATASLPRVVDPPHHPSSPYLVPLLVGINAALVVIMLAIALRFALDAGALAPLANALSLIVIFALGATALTCFVTHVRLISGWLGRPQANSRLRGRHRSSENLSSPLGASRLGHPSSTRYSRAAFDSLTRGRRCARHTSSPCPGGRSPLEGPVPALAHTPQRRRCAPG